MDVEGLWDAYLSSRSIEDRNRLVSHYYPLVKLATDALNIPVFQDKEDLYGYGAIGLIQAVERFEPEQGFQFATFASRRIQGAVRDGLRQEDHLTRTGRRKLNEMRAMLGPEHSSNDEETYQAMVAAAHSRGDHEGAHILHWSRQYNIGHDEDVEHQFDHRRVLAAEQGIDSGQAVDMEALAGLLANRLARLDLKEQVFVLLHYGEERGLKDLEEEFGMPNFRLTRVRQRVLNDLIP